MWVGVQEHERSGASRRGITKVSRGVWILFGIQMLSPDTTPRPLLYTYLEHRGTEDLEGDTNEKKEQRMGAR